MKISYLIDTDWVINHLNKVDKVTQKLKELRPAGIALSVISLAELYEGVYYSKDPGTSQKILDTFLRDFQVLGVDVERGTLLHSLQNLLFSLGMGRRLQVTGYR